MLAGRFQNELIDFPIMFRTQDAKLDMLLKVAPSDEEFVAVRAAKFSKGRCPTMKLLTLVFDSHSFHVF